MKTFVLSTLLFTLLLGSYQCIKNTNYDIGDGIILSDFSVTTVNVPSPEQQVGYKYQLVAQVLSNNPKVKDLTFVPRVNGKAKIQHPDGKDVTPSNPLRLTSAGHSEFFFTPLQEVLTDIGVDIYKNGKKIANREFFKKLIFEVTNKSSQKVVRSAQPNQTVISAGIQTKGGDGKFSAQTGKTALIQ